jgi:CysZ protein
MSLLKDIQFGIAGYSKAFSFIKKNHLRRFFLIPIVLNILLFAFGISFVNDLTSNTLDYFESWASPDSWEFWGAEFLASTIGFLVWLILKIFFFFLFAFLGGYIILILLSPLLAYISEKTEKIINQTDYPFSWPQLFKDMIRGIIIAIRNFAFEMIAIVVLFFLSFVPLVGLLSAPLLFIVSSYFYGFSFLDYTAERRKLKLKDSIFFIKRNKGLAITNGSLFAGALLIPLVGVSLSGFMAIISTVAATISILEKEKKEGTILRP